MWIIPNPPSTTPLNNGSSASARASAVSTSDYESLSLLCASSLMWRGKDLPPRSWLRLLKKERWTGLLCGRIYAPSTATLIVTAFTASLEVIPVRGRALPGSDAGLMTPDGSGRKLPASLMNAAPDGASLRTSPITPIKDSASSDQSWKRWVSELRREYSARRRSARRIDGKGCSFSQWPTATTMDAQSSGAAAYSTESGRHSGTTLTDKAVRQWPTPTMPYGTNQGGAMGRTGPMRPSLEGASKQWSTPRASPNENRNTKPAPSHGDGHGRTLAGDVQSWSTPTTRDYRSESCTPEWDASRASDPRGISLARQAPRTMTDGPLSSLLAGWTSYRLSLNPFFVCWLMGWPEKWTNSGRAGMESWLYRQRMLLRFLLGDSQLD